MAINLNDNIKVSSTLPGFTREQYATKAEMMSADHRGLSSGLIAYCLEDKTHYTFKRSDESNDSDGAWEALSLGGGGGDTSNLELLIDRVADYSSKSNAHIKMKYRDHYDIPNGSLNFVSPLYKFFGWYTPEAMHGSTKADDAAGSKKFYVPSVYRWIGDSSLSIETISESDTKIGAEGSRRVEPYTTEYNTAYMDLVNNGFTWKHELTGNVRTVPPKSTSSFGNMKTLSTGLFHQNVEGMNLNTGHEVDIVGMYINWAGVPDGGYIRLSVSKHNTAPSTFRLLVKNTDTSSSKVGTFLYKGFEDDIKTLDQYNAEKNYYYYEGMGESLKIEKPAEKGTLILLESRGNGAHNDTMQGLIFNVFFPEAYYNECTRGINQSEFTYIKDLTPMGKANNALAQFSEYNYLPSWPKNGDILKVIETLDASKDAKPTFRQFICIHGVGFTGGMVEDNFINPGKDKHPDFLRYSFPIGKDINPVFYDYFFGLNGKLNQYFTRFKEIFPDVHIPKVESQVVILPNEETYLNKSASGELKEGVLYVIQE